MAVYLARLCTAIHPNPSPHPLAPPPISQIQIVVDHVRGYALQRSSTSIASHHHTFQKELGSFEVCLSSTQTTWTVGMYTKAVLGRGSSSIKAGDIVQLSDKEHDGIISMTKMCKCASGEDLTLSGDKPAVHQAYLNMGIDDDGGYRQESLSYWQVYSFGNPSFGGALTYNEHIALRHLASGRYLALRGGRTPGEMTEPVFEDRFDPEDHDLAFSFRPGLHFAGEAEVDSDSVLRLCHEASGSFLTTLQEPVQALDAQTYVQLRAKGDKVEDDDLKDRMRVAFRTKDKFTYEDVIVIRKVAEGDVDDFAFVNGLRPFIDLAVLVTSPAVVATYPSVLPTGKAKANGGDLTYTNGGRDIIGQYPLEKKPNANYPALCARV